MDAREMTNDTAKKPRSPLARAGRALALVLAGAALIAAAVAAVLLFSKTRGMILSKVLSRADAALPGDLSIEEASWPSLETLEFTGISWVDGADSLVAADRVFVSVDLMSLFDKDIRVENAIVEGASVDVPAIRTKFAKPEKTPAKKEKDDGGFPRHGSIPGIPSIYAERILIGASSVRLSETSELNGIAADLGFDLTSGAAPWVRIDTLAVAGPAGSWRVDGLSLFVAPDRGIIEGKGSGALSPHRPVRLSVSPKGRDRFALALETAPADTIFSGGAIDTAAAIPAGGKSPRSAAEQAGGPDSTRAAAGAWLDVTLSREGLRVKSFVFDGRIRTPGTVELSKTPLLGPRVAALPDLEGIGLAVRGTVVLGDERSADVECSFEKNNWIEGGEIAARYGKDGLFLRNIVLEFPDLSIAGQAALGADSLTASAEIRVRGSRWLEIVFPDVEHPDPLSASIGLVAAQARNGSVVRARLTASGTAGSFALDSLDVSAELSRDGAAASRVVLTAEALGYCVGLGADVVREPDIFCSLAPIVLQTTPVDPSRIVFSGGAKREIRYSPSKKTVLIENALITGDMGELTIGADLDAEKRGAFSLDYRAATPPPVLIGALGLSDEKTKRLRAEWALDAPFTLAVDGRLLSTEGPRLTGSGTFSLPGPRNLAVLFPDSARVGDLGALRGNISFMTAPGPAGMSFGAGIDFASTEWIRSSAVRVRGGSGEVVIDTTGIAVDGITAGLSGRIDHGVFDVTANLSVRDSGFARRFSRGIPDLVLEGAADFKGTPEKPVVSAAAGGSLKGKGYSVPNFTVEVDVDTTRASATARAPAGIVTSQIRLSRAVATVTSVGAGGSLFPLRLSLDAAGERLALKQSLVADTTGGVTIEVDTLGLVFGEQDLRARRPFRVRPLSGNGGFSIENVDLSGTLGKIRLDGVLKPDSSDISGVISVFLPETPPPAVKRPNLWPERVELDFKASGAHDAAANLRVTGIELVDDRRPELSLEMKSDAKGIEAVLAVADSIGDVVRVRASVPADVRIYPPSAALGDGPVSLDAVMSRVPMAARWVAPEGEIQANKIIHLNGRVEAGGTAAEPAGAAKLSIEFPNWPKLSEYKMGVAAVMGSRSGVDSVLKADRLGISSEFAKDFMDRFQTGLSAAIRLERGGRTVLSARGAYPLEVSLHPLRAGVIEGGRVEARIDSEVLPLTDFDPLLPLDIGLGGSAAIALTADGPVHDFSLGGKIETKDLNIAVADKAEVLAKSDVRLSGTRSRPVIEGGIEITRGLIRVPDMPKNLHAREGKALLWSDSLSAAASDTVLASGPVAENAKPKEKSRFAGELGVSIRIPSQFWIRGKGLDIELAGDLHVEEKGGRPFITGDLRAIRGDFIVLGRTLDLERGTVTFYGGDETNPSLDISLTTNVEGTKIEIIVSGTAQKPQIEMRSEPDMSETDIMSVLLFGQSSNDLDDDQADLVKSRSTEMLASLGAAKIQEEIGGELGVDVVTVKSAGVDNEGSAVSLGKYLNPRTLLSYAYPLDSQSQASVSLEYFLKGRFVVKSTYDIHEGLGSLGVGWSKDY